MKWSWRLTRIAGTDISLHASFLLAVVYILLVSQPGSVAEGIIAFGSLVLIFCSVALHELGHSLAASHYGIPVRSIVLWPLGGFALLARAPARELHALLIAVAGPLANLALGGVAWFASLILVPFLVFTNASIGPLASAVLIPASTLLWVLMLINLFLAAFNLLPIYPLDGGRMAQAILTILLGKGIAIAVITWLSWTGGLAIIVAGFVLRDMALLLGGALILYFASTRYPYARDLIRLGSAYLTDRGTFYLLRNDYDGALASYDRVIERRPGQSHIFYRRGMVSLQRQDYQEAYADFDRAVSLKPRDSMALVHRGMMAYRLHDMQRAEADFRRAIELKPRKPMAYNNLAVILLLQGDIEQALANCDRALKLAPDAAPTYDTRAQVYHLDGQYERAIADCDRAIQIMPDWPGSYFIRGSARFALGEHERALAECDLTVQRGLDAALLDEHDLLACIKGNLTWACAYYDRLLHLRPDDVQVYRGRGDAYRVNNYPDKALADYDTVLQLAPDLIAAHMGRGYAHLQRRDIGRAIADFEQVRARALQPALRHEALQMLHSLGAT